MINEIGMETVGVGTGLEIFRAYADRFQDVLKKIPFEAVARLAVAVREAWIDKRQVFLCGNGGSAGNANHLANDLIYGIAKDGLGVRAHSLSANPSVITCLANDVSYPEIFSCQLRVLARPGDLLVVFSGSGNSPNIVSAVKTAREMGMVTCGILGYSGGSCLELVDIPIHFAINDMQVSEDMQLVVGHMVMQWLCENPRTQRPSSEAESRKESGMAQGVR